MSAAGSGRTRWPKCLVVHYMLNGMSGWYHTVPFTPAHERVSEHLKVEPTFRKDLIARGARNIIHGPKYMGRWTFFTGMIPDGLPPGWCQGNDRQQKGAAKTNALCLFSFADNDTALTVYYFPGHYPANPAERLRFARAFAQHVEQHGTPDNNEEGSA